ncbi:hypothetical protein WJX74_002672 [Apatococcus lobatus]|uniref:Uncharacterized protein n=1 Tax=Apatococcus lobatus TaxID=904363 RepID=A0AAW1RP02_9CHLO
MSSPDSSLGRYSAASTANTGTPTYAKKHQGSASSSFPKGAAVHLSSQCTHSACSNFANARIVHTADMQPGSRQ